VYFENELAATYVWQRHDDLAIKAPGPQQCRIQHIGTVGRGDDDDALAALEAIHLDQHLVQGLFALVVAATETGTTMATDRIEFVDEYDAGCLLLGLVEHVAHTRCADTDEHLDKVRAGDREERHFRLARDRLGE
jgi:hypothetical protein